MYVGLDAFGKYKIYKNEDVLLKHKEKFDVCIFDCSTRLKGPLHTMVRTKDIAPYLVPLGIELTIAYQSPELPFMDEATHQFSYDVKTYSEFYAICSMFYQYEGFNFFVYDYYDETSQELTIKDIKLTYHKSEEVKEVFHYFYDAPCSTLTQFLKGHQMKLYVDKIMNNKFLFLLDDGEYYYDHAIPEKFKYIGLPILGSQCFYFFSYKQFHRFEKVKEIEFILGTETFDITHVSERFYPEIENPLATFNIVAFDRSSVMQSLLFLPQYTILQIGFGPENLCIHIRINCEGLDYNVYGNMKDIMNGISLFKIIDSITKI